VTSLQSFRSAIAFVVLASHNAEEALYAPNWARSNIELLAQYTKRDLAETWAGSRLVIPVGVWVYVSTLREGYATRRGAFMAATGGIALYSAIGWLAVRP